MDRRQLHNLGPTALAAALAGLTLLAVWFIGRPAGTPLGFPLDDSWIHMVYGRSLAAEGVLGYNPGEPTTGATSLLWAILLGGVHAVFGHAALATRVAAVLVLGGLLHILTAALCADLAQRMAGPRAGFITGVLVAGNPALAFAALSGMEVALTTALLVAGVRALHLRAWAWAGLWLGLAPLARPEAALAAVALVALSTALHRPVDRPAWFKRALQLGGPALAFGLLVVSRNLAVTGHALPATYYAKVTEVSWAETPQRLWHALQYVLGKTPPVAHGLGLPFLLGLAARRHWPSLLPFVASFAYLLAHVRVSALGEPDVFYAVRYLLPIVPTLTLALVLGALALGEHLRERLRVLPLALLVLLALTQAGMTLQHVSWKLANDTRNIDEVQCAAGRWIAAHVPADRRVATVDAGAVRYFGNRWTLDLMGLNTPMMLWQPAAYTRSHPVVAAVIVPGLAKPPSSPEFVAPWSYRTRDYHVTYVPALGFQAIVTCQKAADSAPRQMVLQGPGMHTMLWCQRF